MAPSEDPSWQPGSSARWSGTPATGSDPSSTVNPYQQPPPLPPEMIELDPSVSVTRPRWWTPLAVSGVSLFVFILFSTVFAVVAVYVVHGRIDMELIRDPDMVIGISSSRWGLFWIIMMPQLFLVLPALTAAWFSKTPMAQRLGLTRGHWPVWAWVAAAAATPLVGLISSLVVGFFMEESENLKMMTKIFREHGNSGFLLPLALMIGATPAICEELLFRGYVQTRLTRSFPPIVGIFVASFLFAAFHLDLVHVIAVFPMGLFLGWISWRSGSLFPAMLGHFVNNVISVVLVTLAPEDKTDVLALPAIAASLSIIAAGILGMAAVSVAAVVYRRPQEAERDIA